MPWSLKILIRSFLISCIVFSCTSEKDELFPGYSKLEQGVYFKILYLGEGKKAISVGDRIAVNLSLKNENDSLLYHTTTFPHRKYEWYALTDNKSALENGFMRLKKGDSASFWMDKYAFRNYFPNMIWNKQSNFLSLNVKVQDIMPADSSEWYEAHWDKLQSIREDLILKKYFEKNHLIPDQIYYEGVYINVEEQGRGRNFQDGDKIYLDYEFELLTDSVLPERTSMKMAFVLGDDDQVVPGLEMALHQLNNGSRATIIIPSHYAFGTEGAQTGLVPPYTPVVFYLTCKLI